MDIFDAAFEIVKEMNMFLSIKTNKGQEEIHNKYETLWCMKFYL